MSILITLEIKSNPSLWRKIDKVDSENIMENLLEKGYEKIKLVGIPIKECFSGVSLWVESDADFLIQCCQNLEDSIALNEYPFSHYSHLGDGLLSIKTLFNKKIAQVTYEYYPGTLISNLVSNTIQISQKEYLWQWRNLAYDLLDIAD